MIVHDGPFGLALNKLLQCRVFRRFNFLWFAHLNDFSLVKHSHSMGDFEGGLNVMADSHAGCLGEFLGVHNETVDGIGGDRIKTCRGLVE